MKSNSVQCFHQASFASQNVFDRHSPSCVSGVALLTGSYFVVWMYIVYPFACWWIFGFFRILAFMNKTPIIFFMGHWFSFLLREFLGVRLLSHALRVFIGSCQSLLTRGCSKCAETVCPTVRLGWVRVPVASHYCQHLPLSYLQSPALSVAV